MTFKVNWEKVHTIVHLSDELILKMLGTYYSKNDIKSASVIEGGCANINVLVHLNNSGNPVILRVYLRDKESAYREQKISALLHGKLPASEFYHVVESFGYTFAITEYLPGKTLRDFLLNNNQCDVSNIMFKVGKALGVISRITFPNSGFFNQNLAIKENINRDGLVSFCLESLENTKVKAIIPQEQREQIETFFKVYRNILPDEAEKNLVHADFDPANILVIEKNGEIEISGILDWEFSFSGSSLCDIANMLRYAHQMPNEYQSSFLEGLLSTGYQLPNFWQMTVNLLNILSLLDCLRHSNPDNRPNQIKDIKELISHILFHLRKVEVILYDSN
jgi:aminoglycoside phosphotransferase (APT) family kinase protein